MPLVDFISPSGDSRIFKSFLSIADSCLGKISSGGTPSFHVNFCSGVYKLDDFLNKYQIQKRPNIPKIWMKATIGHGGE